MRVLTSLPRDTNPGSEARIEGQGNKKTKTQGRSEDRKGLTFPCQISGRQGQHQKPRTRVRDTETGTREPSEKRKKKKKEPLGERDRSQQAGRARPRAAVRGVRRRQGGGAGGGGGKRARTLGTHREPPANPPTHPGGGPR